MPYIGHNPTNAGSFIEVDDFASNFNGSNVAFTLQVGGVDITPNQQNLLVVLDGVLQMSGSAYSVSGSTITFTGAPANGVDLYCVLMGQSASIGQGTIGADELKISGNGTSGQLLSTDGDGTFSYLSTTSITSVGTLSSLTLGGDLLVPQYIKHVGDTDCHIEFGTDEIKLRTGDSSRLIARNSDVEIYPALVATSATFSGNVELTGTSGQHLKFADDSGSSWSGNHAKIQHHNSYMYLQGGSSGIILRTNSGTNALTMDSSGNSNFSKNITLNTSSHSTLLIKGADGCDAELALQSDNADDNTDQWSINAKHSTGGTLHFATYGSGAWTNPLILSHTSATFAGNIIGSGRLQIANNLDATFGVELFNGHATGHGVKIRGGDTSSHYSLYVSDHDQSNMNFQVLGDGKCQTGSELTVGMNSTGFSAVRGSASVQITNGGSINVATGDNHFIMLSENTLGRGALFHCTYPQATPNKMSDPNSIFSASDTSNKVCVYSSTNSSTTTIKNNLGSTLNFRIIVFGV